MHTPLGASSANQLRPWKLRFLLSLIRALHDAIPQRN